MAPDRADRPANGNRGDEGDTTPAPDDARRQGRRLRRSFGLLAALGAVLVVAGLVGLVYTGVASLTSMFLFGWLLLIGGVVGLVQAFQSRKSNFFWLAVVVAAVNLAAGFVILRRPEATAEALTMFAALLFLVGGVFRLVGALVVRGPQFGLALVQGAFGILLGFLVLSRWPDDSLYVIGTFFSIALLFDGLSLLAVSLGARKALSLAEGPGAVAGKGGAEDQERSNN
ncbi:HdeD family acid-resistance protein [Streptomyces sp. NPDC101118]|uniref:HdeD family acid-resistance protein n=1 Tax=Streptomyces sp. NPDC101118 TaxID=3366109 RepID=UPI00382F0BB0